MREVRREERKKSRLRALAGWSRRHPFLSIFLVLLLIGGVWLSIKPAAYQVTHFNAVNCGGLITADTLERIDPNNEVAGKQDMQCFVQAHQQCQSATLSITYVDTDRSANWVFRTANRLGGCTLSALAHEGGCPSPLLCDPSPFVDADCQAMQEEQDGLHFLHCGQWADAVFHI